MYKTIFDSAYNAGQESINIKSSNEYSNMKGMFSDTIDSNKPMFIVKNKTYTSLKIKIRFARSRFITWCKQHNKGYKITNKGGYFFYVEVGKTLSDKKNFAKAFSNVLTRNGINNEILIEATEYN